MRDISRRAGLLLLLGMVLPLMACATPPSNPAALADFEETNDPLEPLNRKIFDFNLYFDRYLLKPVAEAYRDVLPEFSRDALRNFIDNLGEPIIFANDMLQGEFSRAHTTVARFLFNSTFGLGGLIDIASKNGLDRQSGDFGQTLYYWGVGEGPYIVLPVLGPSDPRDAIGMGIDAYADPFTYLASIYGATAAEYGPFIAKGIDERSRNIETLDELQRNAIDFYAQMRSLYRQHRASELRHGEPAPMPELDTLYRIPPSTAALPQ